MPGLLALVGLAGVLEFLEVLVEANLLAVNEMLSNCLGKIECK